MTRPQKKSRDIGTTVKGCCRQRMPDHAEEARQAKVLEKSGREQRGRREVETELWIWGSLPISSVLCAHFCSPVQPVQSRSSVMDPNPQTSLGLPLIHSSFDNIISNTYSALKQCAEH